MKKVSYGCYIKNSEDIAILPLAPFRRTADIFTAKVQTIFEIKK